MTIENAVESAFMKHKTTIDQKIATCVSELDAVKTKVDFIESTQNKLVDEMSILKKEMTEIKSTQEEHHAANTEMHGNTAKLLQKIIDLNVNTEVSDKTKMKKKNMSQTMQQIKPAVNKSAFPQGGNRK